MGAGRERVQPLTIAVPIHRWWLWWLRVSFPLAERVWPVNRITKRRLLGLRFIHFAHWGLATRVPHRGGRRLPVPYVLFHTNYNGDLVSYVDAFSIVVADQLRLQLQGSYGFPGPEPLGPFRRYFFEKAFREDHFWCAYPEASVKTVVAGMALEDELGRLRAAARDGDAAFAAGWERFLERHAERL